ncbi:MAG: TIGR03790 family protein [Mariniblastus sp.]|nr:TIGR03790 family protein [Mariniblastus sp.]
MNPPVLSRSISILALLTLMNLALPGFGQGGAENVLLVVNEESSSSKLLANHYVHLRNIPRSHVVHLSGIAKREATDEADFIKTILQPVMKTIRERKLSNCIDYIVYSSDFPTMVNIPKFQQRLFERWKLEKKNSPLDQRTYAPTASLTSLTYFANQVLDDDPSFMLLDANRYMRAKTDVSRYLPTRSFHSSDSWGKNGQVVDAASSGRSYFISTMLAVTCDEGISERAALDFLNNSVSADGTPPKGTVFFTDNAGARSRARKANFDDAIAQLDALKIKTKKILSAVTPANEDVAGFVAGAPNMDLAKSQCRFSPGSICENLTSIGAKFTSKSQIKCTEFLRYGAAGSSGCVVEPYAIQAKFPHPMIQVHYARGCTMGEAFYQSIHGPFQILIVGDPLCRPYGVSPILADIGKSDGLNTIQGSVVWNIEVRNEVQIGKLNLFVDGSKVGERPFNSKLTFNSKTMSDGYHEVRVVAVADNAIETNSSKTIHLLVENERRRLSINSNQKQYDVSGQVTVDVTSNFDGQVTLYCQDLALGSLSRRKGSISFDAAMPGRGPIELVAISKFDGKIIQSAPLEVYISGTILDN